MDVKKVTHEKTRRALVVVLLGIGLGLMVGGCESSGGNEPTDTVVVVSDNTVNFSEFSTFALVESEADPENPPPDVSEGDKQALISAIISNMNALDYVQVPEDEADLLISSFAFIETLEAAVTGYYYEYYYGWYWSDMYWYYDEDEVEFDVITVVIDAVDVKDKAVAEDDRLVFRGNVFGIFADEPTESAGRITDAVNDIFDEWPED
ncbi:MAG: DUF4136 domain-containing protein [Proteobacteria bacterium]|nr:DUF4136 domain-containing protein [Pseudomonadota bacterium]